MVRALTCIELFAGIGGFRLAAEACGLRTIWANDICPDACTVYRDRFGGREIVEGSIDDFMNLIPKHKLLTGGFPCQPFSSAGKKQGINDPRGTLFHRIVEIVRKHQPRYFVLENVKRLLTMESGRHFATILDCLASLNYDVEWRLMKAPDFGLPQNRHRVFIIGVRADLSGNRESLPIRLAGPQDLASGIHRSRRRLQDRTSWPEISRHGVKFPNWGVARDGRFFACDLGLFSEATPYATLRSVLQPSNEVDPQFDFTESTLARLERSETVNRYVDGVEILSNQGGGARMGYTVFGINGIAPCLTATPSRHYERYEIDQRYRRLTNIEYARLQGFSEEHCSAVSIYTQYSLYGNAVPPAMAAWAIRKVMTAGLSERELPVRESQKVLFADA